MPVYLNNAATTYPKPAPVAEAVSDFIVHSGANFSRGSASDRDLSTMDIVLTCRDQLSDLFHAEDSRFVTFTSNVTEALNVVLKGFLQTGMSVMTTSMEHNAVIRPLRGLEKKGVALEILPCDSRGTLSFEIFLDRLKSRPDLAVVSHASNVCGTVQDLCAIAAACREFSVPLVVDAAQTAGLVDIDVSGLGLAALCFTGHKGLMGPQGTGGIVWSPNFADRCEPFIEGGTGSFSHDEHQPSAMPDKYESGTLNLPGIAGLSAAIDFLNAEGLDVVAAHEEKLGTMLLDGLKKMDGVVLYGKEDFSEARMPVFALNLDRIDNARAAHVLSTEFGIETRPGLHCSPLAHQTLGSFPQGALRLSPGYFNTEDQIAYTLESLQNIAVR